MFDKMTQLKSRINEDNIFFHFVGALKPKDHCCYDICGAVIHIETQAAQYGYADTLEIIKNAIKRYIPNEDITAADNKGDYPYPYVSPCVTFFSIWIHEGILTVMWSRINYVLSSFKAGR